MRKLDQIISTMAGCKGVKLAADELKSVRLQLETAYLDSILDGREPFDTVKQGDSDGRANGKEKRDISGQNTNNGQAELHG